MDPITAGIILAAILATWGGYAMGRRSHAAEDEKARRLDYCYIGGVESDGLPFEHPSHWRCNPLDPESLRDAGYPITDEEIAEWNSPEELPT